jgi:hypothetical protein
MIALEICRQALAFPSWPSRFASSPALTAAKLTRFLTTSSYLAPLQQTAIPHEKPDNRIRIKPWESFSAAGTKIRFFCLGDLGWTVPEKIKGLLESVQQPNVSRRPRPRRLHT